MAGAIPSKDTMEPRQAAAKDRDDGNDDEEEQEEKEEEEVEDVKRSPPRQGTFRHRLAWGRKGTKKHKSRFVVLESEQEQDMYDVHSCRCNEIIDPNSMFKTVWDHYVLLLIVYTLVSLPLEIAFDPLSDSTALLLDIVVTAGFAVNMIVQFRTAVDGIDALIWDPNTIARVYFRKWFWLDLIATIPWDVIFRQSLGSEGSLLTLARLIRLFRVLRLFSGDRFSIAYSKTAVRMLHMITSALILAHWFACAYFALSDIESFSGDGIVAGPFLERQSMSYQYLVCFHWAVRSLLSIGSELNPTTDLQIWLALFAIVAGVLVFSIIIGNIEIMLAQNAATSIRFQEHVQSLEEFCHHHRMPERLKKNILAHTTNWYRANRGMDEASLLACLPAETQKKVYRVMYKKALTSCSFFSSCDMTFIDALCSEVRREVALKGDIIIRQGSLGSEMYIIEVGTAEAVDLVTQETHSVIPEGAFFGEIALFATMPRTLSVRAKSFMKLFVLTKESFLQLLDLFPAEKSLFQEVAHRRLKNTEKIAHEIHRHSALPRLLPIGTLDGRAMEATLQELHEESSDSEVPDIYDDDQARQFLEDNDLEDVFEAHDVAGLMSKFDENRDGVLDAEERTQILKYLRAKADRLRVVQGVLGNERRMSKDSDSPSMPNPRSGDIEPTASSKADAGPRRVWHGAEDARGSLQTTATHLQAHDNGTGGTDRLRKTASRASVSVLSDSLDVLGHPSGRRSSRWATRKPMPRGSSPAARASAAPTSRPERMLTALERLALDIQGVVGRLRLHVAAPHEFHRAGSAQQSRKTQGGDSLRDRMRRAKSFNVADARSVSGLGKPAFQVLLNAADPPSMQSPPARLELPEMPS